MAQRRAGRLPALRGAPVWLGAGARLPHLQAIPSLGDRRRAVLKLLLRALGRDSGVPTALGLERDGERLLTPFCRPPHDRTMEEAVLAVVDYKYAQGAAPRAMVGHTGPGATARPAQAGIPRYSDEAIAATIAYCEYIYKRYGRLPSSQRRPVPHRAGLPGSSPRH